MKSKMKLSQSQRKYIRNQKAQIRRDRSEDEKRKENLSEWIKKERELKQSKANKHSS